MRGVAIVGAGIIGSSWALTFARAGWRVAVFARHAAVRESLLTRIRDMATRAGAMSARAPDEIVSRVSLAPSLESAVADAEWVQESVEERIAVKREIFAAIDAVASPAAIVASSTSSIGASQFTEPLAGRERCIVAHPATPPHLLPVIEVVPAPWTPAHIVSRAFDTMRGIGQVPVLVRREQPGFVMNRLQVALLTEMLRVVADGLMTPGDVDALIRDGFGLRWAFLGPLEGIDLNAPGGIADYLARYGFMFDQLARERGTTEPVVTPEVVAALHDAMRARLPLGELTRRVAWRDERIASLRALRDALASTPEVTP